MSHMMVYAGAKGRALEDVYNLRRRKEDLQYRQFEVRF